MGIIVVAVGAVIVRDTPLAYLQILGGAFLVWAGVRDEIKKAQGPK